MQQILILTILLLIQPLHAADALYQTEQTVSATEPWQETIQLGAVDILIRLSGNRKISHHPELVNKLSGEDNLVHFYEQINHTENTWRLTYHPDPLKRILAELGQPVWQAPRPQIMIAIRIQPHHGDSVILQKDHMQSELINRITEQYHLPWMTPLDDLDDQQYWQQSSTVTIEHLQTRYPVHHILYGQLEEISPGEYRSEWLSRHQDSQFQWTHPTASSEQTLLAAMDQMIEQIANLYGKTEHAQQQNSATIAIDHVHSLRDLKQAMQILQSFSDKAVVEISRIRGNLVTFTMQYPTAVQELSLFLNQHRQLSVPSHRDDHADAYYQLISQS